MLVGFSAFLLFSFYLTNRRPSQRPRSCNQLEEAPDSAKKLVDITEENTFCVSLAAKNGHLDVVRYLFEEAPFITGQLPPLPLYDDLNQLLPDTLNLFEKLKTLAENGTPHTLWREALEVLESEAAPVRRPRI